jgi:hypothetical protein
MYCALSRGSGFGRLSYGLVAVVVRKKVVTTGGGDGVRKIARNAAVIRERLSGKAIKPSRII